MKLTIITVTYNSVATLENCMQSVLAQDYPHLEYWVVDGGSTDGTAALLARYQQEDPRIRFVSEPDFGIYDALNKGVRLATGEVLGFVHADDFLAHPQTASRIVQRFQNTGADGVYGDLLYVDKQHPGKIIRYWKSSPFRPRRLHQGWMPAHPTFFLKKAVYEKHGWFNLGYHISADYDFMLRVLKDEQLRFAYLPEVVTLMRVGGTSNRSLKNIFRKSREDLQAIRGNGLPFPLWVLLAKNLSKLPQFVMR